VTIDSLVMHQGDGWYAADVVCSSGPGDRAFQEQHETICMAVVLAGTFAYRGSSGSAVLAPGAVLIGNPGDGFECSHTHSVGDHCLSFHFTKAFVERVLGETAPPRFARPHLPPRPTAVRLIAEAQRAAKHRERLEELAIELIGGVALALPPDQPASVPSLRAAGRVQDLVRFLETDFRRDLRLDQLAAEACLSPYHLLREFRRIVGMTPYQLILLLRMKEAAQRLRDQSGTILSVALDSGFPDVSEFNRRFRRLFGTSPTAYRRSASSSAVSYG